MSFRLDHHFAVGADVSGGGLAAGLAGVQAFLILGFNGCSCFRGFLGLLFQKPPIKRLLGPG